MRIIVAKYHKVTLLHILVGHWLISFLQVIFEQFWVTFIILIFGDNTFQSCLAWHALTVSSGLLILSISLNKKAEFLTKYVLIGISQKAIPRVFENSQVSFHHLFKRCCSSIKPIVVCIVAKSRISYKENILSIKFKEK